MPADDVKKLAANLQSAGVVNLDTKLGDLLKIEGVGAIDPASPVASNVIAWDGYVLITAAHLQGQEKILPDQRPQR